MLAIIWCRIIFFLLSKILKIYKTIILPVVLYECETWSLILTEECRVKVLRIFGHHRDKVTGEWRKQQNEELTDLYCSPNITWLIKLQNEELTDLYSSPNIT